MDLSDAQVDSLFNRYWAGEANACPGCGATLKCRHTNVLGGYMLCCTCPKGCELPELPSERDPKAGSFRDWLRAEGDRAIADFAADRAPSCAACAVKLEGEIKWVFSGRLVQVRCPRCRRVFEDSLAR